MVAFLIPALGGLASSVGGGAAAVGGAASGVFDNGIGGAMQKVTGGENKYSANAYEVDPKAYEYGGFRGGAMASVDDRWRRGAAAQKRDGVDINYKNANRGRILGELSRRNENSMAGLIAARARGEAPSIAGMQAERDMNRVAAEQASAAASARGAAGMALAQQGAANNVVNAQAGISNQAQINAAQERLAAEQSAMNAYGQMRQGDAAMQQMGAQMGQAQAQLKDQQRARNDAYDLQMQNNAQAVQMAQLQAQMNREAQKSGNTAGAQQINAGVSGQNAANRQQLGGQVLSSGGQALGSALSKADGGPVRGTQAYLVGERGPELVVPAHDATVIPAGPTKEIVSRANGGFLGGLFGPRVQPSMERAARGGAYATPMGIEEDPYGLYGQMGSGVKGGDALGPAAAIQASLERSVSQRASGGPMKAPAAPAPKAGNGAGRFSGDMLSGMFSSGPAAEYRQSGGYVPPVLLSVMPRVHGGEMDAPDVMPLYEPEGQQLHQGADGRAFLVASNDEPSREEAWRQKLGLAGMSRSKPAREELKADAGQLLMRVPVAPEKSAKEARKMPMRDLKSEADKLLEQMRAEHEARMATGPTVGGLARMRGY